MASFILFSILSITTTSVYGQYYGNYNSQVKSGSCSPPMSVDECSNKCSADYHCLGIEKCCPTSCGSYVCSRPVTTKNPVKIVKPGVCPNTSTGRWVCSSTCVDDSDCRDVNKCCRTQCGGFICKKPQAPVEVLPPNDERIPSNTIPFENNNNNYYPIEQPYNPNRNNPFLFGRYN